jgi:hypothetical protein
MCSQIMVCKNLNKIEQMDNADKDECKLARDGRRRDRSVLTYKDIRMGAQDNYNELRVV